MSAAASTHNQPEETVDNAHQPGPFAGLRIMELGQYVAVPYCAELFAHGGAEVIKVEPIDGDQTRKNSEIVPGEGRQFIIKARGKKGIPIDLGTAEGREIARRLALSSDVLLSNMRPGALEKLELDYPHLWPLHPPLILGEVTAFGRAGADSERPGLDVIVQAESGLTLSGRAWDGDVPVGSEAFLTDYMAGMTLAFGIVTALRERDRTGRGQHVTTSLLQAALALQTATANVIDAVDGWKRDFVAERQAGGTSHESFLQRRRQMGTNRWFYNTYATKDGFIALGAAGDLRGRLMRVVGIDDPSVSDPGFRMPDDPRPFIDTMKARAKTAVAGFTTRELLDRCVAEGVPAAPVSYVEEVVLGEHARVSGFIATFDHPVVGPITMPTVPVNFSESTYASAHTSPAYGEHTAEVLRSLGVAEPEAGSLVARRIVGSSERTPFR